MGLVALLGSLQEVNLPGWRWARIKQLALVRSSSSRHSEACKALGGSSGAVHSEISDCCSLRSRGCNDERCQSRARRFGDLQCRGCVELRVCVLVCLLPRESRHSDIPLRHCHTFSAFWLRSSVVSVLISMTTDMLPSATNPVIKFLAGLQLRQLATACSAVSKALHIRFLKAAWGVRERALRSPKSQP